MSKSKPIHYDNFSFGGTVGGYRIVKHGSGDDTVVQASAATDFVIGISDSPGGVSGEGGDVCRVGIHPLTYGGSVTRGAALMSDSEGRGITATASAGVNIRIIGFAEVSGVSGDTGSCFIAPGFFQGAT